MAASARRRRGGRRGCGWWWWWWGCGGGVWYLDGHGFRGAVESGPQSVLHRVDALVAVARHLDICGRNEAEVVVVVGGGPMMLHGGLLGGRPGGGNLTCSDFDGLWGESPVDVVDQLSPLVLRQVQAVQDGRVSAGQDGQL